MPISTIKDLVAGLFSIGLGPALQTLWFTEQKRQLDRQYEATRGQPSEQPIGAFLQTNPQADGAAYSFENAELEIRFLADELVRISWTPGQEPLSYTLAAREWPLVDVHHEETTSGYWLNTARLSVGIEKNGMVRFFSHEGLLIREELPPIRRGEGWIHQAALREEEAVYGLGERNGPANRVGRSYRMWNLDPGLKVEVDIDPVYLCVPVYLSLHRSGSCLVYYENYGRSVFHAGARSESAPVIAAAFETGMLREYVVLGTLPEIYARYGELTGYAPLPPRWALGYHQSRWGYKTESDIRQVAARAAQEGIRLSAIHLDIDYMNGFRVFTVNKKRFPSLPKLSAEMEAQQIRLVTIVDPGVKIDRRYDIFRSGMTKKVYCTTPGGGIARGVVWPGLSAFPDFTDAGVRRWWGGWYSRLLDQGIAGIWHDMNEPACLSASSEVEATLPSQVRHSLEGTGGDHSQAHNLYGFLMNRAGFEALKSLRPDRRPWILSRSGWAGLQRYAWNWTGDVNSTWEALRQSVPTLLGLGLSGLPFNGTDVGGYFGFPEPELYIRWLQLGCFSPLFRGHSAKGFDAHEPWGFGDEALRIAREFIQLRYQLMPYLYTTAWQSAKTGCPMVRPLLWAAPDDPRLWNVDDAFLLGDALLIAPVVQARKTRREVCLPAGEWIDFWSGERLDGGRTAEIAAPLERIPVLVKSGSMLPIQGETGLELHAYGPGPWLGTLYDDAGDGYGPSRVDRFHLVIDSGVPHLTRQSEGGYDPGGQEPRIVIHTAESTPGEERPDQS